MTNDQNTPWPIAAAHRFRDMNNDDAEPTEVVDVPGGADVTICDRRVAAIRYADGAWRMYALGFSLRCLSPEHVEQVLLMVSDIYGRKAGRLIDTLVGEAAFEMLSPTAPRPTCDPPATDPPAGVARSGAVATTSCSATPILGGRTIVMGAGMVIK